MAMTNAQRQAAYRQRRDSERISEEDLKLMLFHAYMIGMSDQRKGTDVFKDGCNDAAVWKQRVYERTCDDAAATALEIQRRFG